MGRGSKEERPFILGEDSRPLDARTPLVIEFEESGSDLDEVPIDNLRLKKKRGGKASASQVQDGDHFLATNRPVPRASLFQTQANEKYNQADRTFIPTHQPCA